MGARLSRTRGAVDGHKEAPRPRDPPQVHALRQRQRSALGPDRRWRLRAVVRWVRAESGRHGRTFARGGSDTSCEACAAGDRDRHVARKEGDEVMGAHIVNGQFQSDKYPTCPPGKVPLSVKDKRAQPFLWGFAQAHREVDAEFSDDLETALRAAGTVPPHEMYYKCQPSARGLTAARVQPVPLCSKCGRRCSGGHWVEP